jgi:hypothetical protein
VNLRPLDVRLGVADNDGLSSSEDCLSLVASSAGFLLLRLIVVVSTGSGRNFLRPVGGDEPEWSFWRLSRLLLMLVSIGSGANFFLELFVVFSMGSGAKRRGRGSVDTDSCSFVF